MPGARLNKYTEFLAKYMQRLNGAKSLRWEQTGKLASRLIAADAKEELATLIWAKRWGSLATGEAADGKWTLKRIGFLRPRVTVREAGSDAELAVLSISWMGDGTVNFSDGEVFQLKRSGFWRPEWSVSDSTGESLLTLRPDAGWKRKESKVEIKGAGSATASSSSSSRVVLLAILAWYVTLLIADYDYGDGTGASTTAAVMAASGF